jgi:hypothetical protein
MVLKAYNMIIGYSKIMYKQPWSLKIMLGFCFLTLIQCSSDSETKSTSSVVGGELSVKNSQLLFGFNFINKLEELPGYAECKFEFKTDGFPPKKFIVRAKVGQRTVLAPVAFPQFKLSGIDCGDYGSLTKDIFNPENPLIKMESDRVQFAGLYELTTRNRELSVQLRKQWSLDFLRRVAFESGASWGGRLYSAYSSKQIQAGMIPKSISNPVIVVKTSGAKTKNIALIDREKRGLEKLIQSCMLDENFRNPIVVGFLAMQVKFSNGKFDQFEKVQDRGTYTKEFHDCVKSKLQEHDSKDPSISRAAFKI